jgi:hypothetical protein
MSPYTTPREHLYRNHMLSIHCLRCQHTFPTEIQLFDHTRAEPPCLASPNPPLEGLNALQERRLRSRKRDTEVRTEEDKWRKVYKILFSDADENQIPSPCECNPVKALHCRVMLADLRTYRLR